MKTALSYGLCAVFFVAEGFGGERTVRAGDYGGICEGGLLCEILQVLHVFTGFCPGFAGGAYGSGRKLRRDLRGVCARLLRRLDGFAGVDCFAESVRGLRLREVSGFREMFCGLLSVFSELL